MVAGNNRPGDLPECKSLKIRPVMLITGFFFLPVADVRLYSIGLLLVGKKSGAFGRGYGVSEPASAWDVPPAAPDFPQSAVIPFIR